MTAAGDPHAIHGPWQLNHPMNIEIITINLKSSMEFLSFNRIANDVCNEFLFYFILFLIFFLMKQFPQSVKNADHLSCLVATRECRFVHGIPK